MEFSPHRLWLMLAAVALLVLAGLPVARYLAEGEAGQAARIAAARQQDERALRRIEEDLLAARDLKNNLGAGEIARLLAPADRLQAAARLEQAAQAARISHFTYTLAPERQSRVDSAAGPQELALSTVTLAGDAPLDTDIYRFVARAREMLPGRAKLKQLSVMRLGNPPAAANVHMEAVFEWLSNGAQSVGSGS
jgi:hypothetical protein